MPTTLTYSPPPPQNSAVCLRPYPCRYARYAEIHPVQLLKGLWEPRAVSVSYQAFVPAGHDGCGVSPSYRALAPHGAILPFRITATHTLAKQSSDHCPHTYGVRHLPCDPIATEPYRPTACGGEHPCCTVAYTTTANYSLLTANWTFTFSAKERDPETGLSYFGSRYYSSDLSIWLSVDPQSDKYASLSPYVYCANNPVKLVDPNGEDFIIVNETTGNVKVLKFPSFVDVLICQHGKKFKYETLSANGVFARALTYDEKKGTLISGMSKSDAIKTFNFMADNTNVEWGYMETVDKHGTSSYTVGTAHSSETESLVYNLAMDAPKESVLRYDHNHLRTDTENTSGWPSTPISKTKENYVDTDAWSDLMRRNPNVSLGIRHRYLTSTYIRNGEIKDNSIRKYIKR